MMGLHYQLIHDIKMDKFNELASGHVGARKVPFVSLDVLLYTNLVDKTTFLQPLEH